jgi:hypothetical protein
MVKRMKPQTIKVPVFCARLDYQPVRYTISEAWWIPEDGMPWREIDPAATMHDGAMMTNQQFKKMFPRLPPLPKDAFAD